MNQIAIDKILRKDSQTGNIFLGVFARDELPPAIDFPACLVFNTQKRSEPGEHWLAIHYDLNGCCTFFDSFANHPSKFGMVEYLEKTSKNWSYNKQGIQGPSFLCGFYCVSFLFFKCRNQELDFFKSFEKNKINNDKKVMNLISKFI